MTVNGYAVERAATGAWWVRPPGRRLAWRFGTWYEALHFADRLRPAGPASARATIREGLVPARRPGPCGAAPSATG